MFVTTLTVTEQPTPANPPTRSTAGGSLHSSTRQRSSGHTSTVESPCVAHSWHFTEAATTIVCDHTTPNPAAAFHYLLGLTKTSNEQVGATGQLTTPWQETIGADLLSLGGDLLNQGGHLEPNSSGTLETDSTTQQPTSGKLPAATDFGALTDSGAPANLVLQAQTSNNTSLGNNTIHDGSEADAPPRETAISGDSTITGKASIPGKSVCGHSGHGERRHLPDQPALSDSLTRHATDAPHHTTQAPHHSGQWQHHQPHQLTEPPPWKPHVWRQRSRQHFPQLDDTVADDAVMSLWRELTAADPLSTTPRQRAARHYLATGDLSVWETTKAAQTRQRELTQLTHLMAKYGVTAPPPDIAESHNTASTNTASTSAGSTSAGPADDTSAGLTGPAESMTPTSLEYEAETHVQQILDSLTTGQQSAHQVDDHAMRLCHQLDRQLVRAQQEMLTLHSEKNRWVNNHTPSANPNSSLHQIAAAEITRLSAAITSQQHLIDELNSQRNKVMTLPPVDEEVSRDLAESRFDQPHIGQIHVLLQQAVAAEILRRQHLAATLISTAGDAQTTNGALSVSEGQPDGGSEGQPGSDGQVGGDFVQLCLSQLPAGVSESTAVEVTAWTRHLTTVTTAVTEGRCPPFLVHNFTTRYHSPPDWLPIWQSLASDYIKTITAPTGQAMQYIVVTPDTKRTPAS